VNQWSRYPTTGAGGVRAGHLRDAIARGLTAYVHELRALAEGPDDDATPPEGLAAPSLFSQPVSV
jgi:hypothetical protein